MVSPLASAVVIECPQCGTRYQLPPEALGPKGRKVACAHCGGTWQARALPPAAATRDPDTMFDAAAEAALDAAFAEVEQATALAAAAAAAPVPPEPADPPAAASVEAISPLSPVEPVPSQPVDRKRQKDFNRRQAALIRRLPLARVRRSVRIAGVLALGLLVVGGIVFRTEIVRQVPDLAGLYAAVGLGVNVVGLEFYDVTTLVALHNGSNVMQVDARIRGVAPRPVRVPPVLVTLLDAAGNPVYEWRVAPEAGDLGPGEVAEFSTRLASPPAAATRVRLTFTDGKARAEGPVPDAAAKSE